MTEELEKKLNELMEFKKRLDAISEERMMSAADSAIIRYRRQAIINVAFLVFRYVLGIGLIIIGVLGLEYGPDKVRIGTDNFLAVILAGVFVLIIAKAYWLIYGSKLAILREMKEFELRITEMLRKQPPE